MVADFHSILARWSNHISQMLNVHGFNDVRQSEIHTAEPLIPEPRASEVELAIEKLKSHKSPGIDQIPAELIKAGGKTIHCEIHKLVISVWNKEALPEEWKESIIVSVYKKGDKRDYSYYRSISLLPTIYKILANILLSRLTPYTEEIIGDHQCGFRRSRSTTYHIFRIHQIFFFFQWRYSPGWASASFKSFLHPFWFRAAAVQFLHPSFATSSFTPSSHRNLGLPLGRFPPGSLRRTLLAKSSSSWRMTCPAHLSLLSLQNFTMSFSSYSL